MHTCRHGRLDPVKNAQYWKHKRQRNAERDRDNLTELRRLGWAVLIVWECRTKNSAALERKILDFLSRRTERF
jgi:DNA mismatch endonuclease (patch repair protein)